MFNGALRHYAGELMSAQVHPMDYWVWLPFLAFFVWLVFFQPKRTTPLTEAERRRAVVLAVVGAVVGVGLVSGLVFQGRRAPAVPLKASPAVQAVPVATPPVVQPR